MRKTNAKPKKKKTSENSNRKPRRRRLGSLLESGRISPPLGTTWDDTLRLLKEFRRGHKGKWPSRDSDDPTEAWLAAWFRHNLELMHSRRLDTYKSARIQELLLGESVPRNRYKPFI